MTYSIKYREKGQPFEARPTYYYPCLICRAVIRGEDGRGTILRKGQQAIDVLVQGQTRTVHVSCNRRYGYQGLP